MPPYNRTMFFVDGFNVYYAIDTPRLCKYKWLNYWTLAKQFLRGRDRLPDVLYFTAYPPWDPAKRKRHECLVSANEAQGVKAVLGKKTYLLPALQGGECDHVNPLDDHRKSHFGSRSGNARRRANRGGVASARGGSRPDGVESAGGLRAANAGSMEAGRATGGGVWRGWHDPRSDQWPRAFRRGFGDCAMWARE